jgi:hypothetical protein
MHHGQSEKYALFFFVKLSFLMKRHWFTSKQLIALLLPFTFLWSWAACESSCAEITLHHQGVVSAAKISEKENCLSLTEREDGCTMTAVIALIQDRQTVEYSHTLESALPVLPYRAPKPAWAARLPEIKQNSPPLKLSPPSLFIRLCTFRI